MARATPTCRSTWRTAMCSTATSRWSTRRARCALRCAVPCCAELLRWAVLCALSRVLCWSALPTLVSLGFTAATLLHRMPSQLAPSRLPAQPRALRRLPAQPMPFLHSRAMYRCSLHAHCRSTPASSTAQRSSARSWWLLSALWWTTRCSASSSSRSRWALCAALCLLRRMLFCVPSHFGALVSQQGATHGRASQRTLHPVNVCTNALRF